LSHQGYSSLYTGGGLRRSRRGEASPLASTRRRSQPTSGTAAWRSRTTATDIWCRATGWGCFSGRRLPRAGRRARQSRDSGYPCQRVPAASGVSSPGPHASSFHPRIPLNQAGFGL